MSWICTELDKKLAELPRWKWKFASPKFSPLNNDYVVQLRASLLSNAKRFGVRMVLSWSGKKKNKKYELNFLVSFQLIINHEVFFCPRPRSESNLASGSWRLPNRAQKHLQLFAFSCCSRCGPELVSKAFSLFRPLVFRELKFYVGAASELCCVRNLIFAARESQTEGLIWYFMYTLHTIGASKLGELFSINNSILFSCANALSASSTRGRKAKLFLKSNLPIKIWILTVEDVVLSTEQLKVPLWTFSACIMEILLLRHV